MRYTRLPLALATLVGLAALVALATPAAAEIDGDVRIGYYTDAEEPMIGGGILTHLDDRWYFNPNGEYVLVDNGDLLTINADFHYDFPLNDRWNWWLGAGPALILADPDPGDSDTDLGANLLVGAGATQGRVRPFVQGKVVVADDSEFVVGFGIRF